MALPSSEVSDRGRSLTPGRSTVSRGSLGYSSFSVPSRSRSPYYISPDRGNRNVSPGRFLEDQESTEVVSRIPQPYRTSFSAVTSPQRITRTPSADRSSSRSRSISPFIRGNTQYVSMPYRGASPAAKLTPTDKDSRYLNVLSTRTNIPQSANTSASPNSSSLDNQLCANDQNQSAMVNGVDNVDGTTDVISYKTSPVHKSLKDGDADVHQFMSSSTANGTAGSVSLGTSKSSGGHPPSPPPEVVIVGPVEKKTLIKKEYVHVQSINYFKALDKKLPKENLETDKVLKDLLKSRQKKSKNAKEGESHKPDSLPGSPDLSPMIREGRSSTMPSDTLLRKKPNNSTPVKKSLSTSITNFFKRMSPKSLRRLSRGSKVETPGSSTSSLQAEQSCDSADNLSEHSDHSGHVTGANSKSRSKSPKTSPILKLMNRKKSREDLLNASSNGVSKENKPKEVITIVTKDTADQVIDTSDRTVHPLPSDSARILKSIEEHAHAANEKSVYQSFKEKQSPRRVTEASGLKPQALKVVEFPENILHDHLSSVPEDDQPPNLDSPPVNSPPSTLDTRQPNMPSKQNNLGFRSCQHKEDLPGTTLEPPRTLNVREVAKLSKGMFAFPSMSAESIGQCSLDVYATDERTGPRGSEPSLASRNGQRSSVTASKRTLVSQDTSSPHKSQATHSLSDVSNHHETEIPATDTTTLPNTVIDPGTISGDETPSKTPSYLKISCAISGYNKYSSYGTPPEQSRIRIIKHHDSDPSDSVEVPVQQGLEISHNSHQHVSSDRTLINGSSVDEVDSSRPLLRNGASAVANGPTKELITESSLHPSLIGEPSVSHSGEDFKLPLESAEKKESNKSAVNTPSPSKDGHYYIRVIDSEIERISELCDKAESYLDSSTPEEGCGKVRAAVGKAHLLMNKKFDQFRGLCQKNISPDEDDMFKTTAQDLAGFWDMVSLQVEDVNSMFSEIDKLYRQNWCEDKKSPSRSSSSGDTGVRTSAKSTGAVSRSKARVKDGSKSVPSTPKSSKSQEAAKAREEARKRLMAAKRAGRQRKASQSDKDEIEILIA